MYFHLTKQKCWNDLSYKLQHSTVGRNLEERNKGEPISKIPVKHGLDKMHNIDDF